MSKVVSRAWPISFVLLGKISFWSTCLVSGFEISERKLGRLRRGLLLFLLSCNTCSILYQASLARLYPLAGLSCNCASGNWSLEVRLGDFCGTEASVQLMRGKRRSMLLRVPSKSSTYMAPSLPFPICFACPGSSTAASPYAVIDDIVLVE